MSLLSEMKIKVRRIRNTDEISIIINGVQYDATDLGDKAACHRCDLLEQCKEYNTHVDFTEACEVIAGYNRVFKRRT